MGRFWVLISIFGFILGWCLAEIEKSKNPIKKQEFIISKQPDPPQLKTNKEYDNHTDVCKTGIVVAYLRKDGTLVMCVSMEM